MNFNAEKQSFEKLYNELFPLVFKVSFNITGDKNASEDICQEAFIKFYNRPSGFPSQDDAKYWLIRVVKNMSFNYSKRESRKKLIYEKIKHDPVSTNDTGEKEMLRNETKNKVNELLQMLPEKLRAPLVLREFADLNYKEIGKVLGISESNVKVRIFRARASLQKMISIGDIYVP